MNKLDIVTTRGRIFVLFCFVSPPDWHFLSKAVDRLNVLPYLFCLLSVTCRDGIKERCQWWSTWAAQPQTDRTETRPQTGRQGQKTFLAGGKSIRTSVPVIKGRATVLSLTPPNEGYVFGSWIEWTGSDTRECSLEIFGWHFVDGQDCGRVNVRGNIFLDPDKAGKTAVTATEGNLDDYPMHCQNKSFCFSGTSEGLTCSLRCCIHLPGLTFHWSSSWQYTEARLFHRKLCSWVSSPNLAETQTCLILK